MKNAKKNLTGKIGKIFLILILLSTVFCFGKTAKAQQGPSDNLRILYQGTLNNTDGSPVPDGKYNMRFVIYDDEEQGNALWEEDQAFYDNVFIKDGKFKIILGRKNNINLNFSQPVYWLGIRTGNLNETDLVIWNEEIKPRKKVISLSQILKEEGMENLEEDGLSEEEWGTIFDLLEKKMEGQPDLVVLLNTKDFLNNNNTSSESSSKLAGVLKSLINFISGKISQIFEEISKIREKIEGISLKLEGITSVLGEMSFKIDALYKILVQDKGLAPQGSESVFYQSKKTERMIFKTGENSLRVFDQSVQEDSLIFISFLEDPGSNWWISEKVPGYSFDISLKEPAQKDLMFDFWIINEEKKDNPEFLTSTAAQPAEILIASSSQVLVPTENSSGTEPEAKEQAQNQEASQTQETIQSVPSEQAPASSGEPIAPTETPAESDEEAANPES
jgi:hypothetical protein